MSEEKQDEIIARLERIEAMMTRILYVSDQISAGQGHGDRMAVARDTRGELRGGG